ncbi:hypothetical protein [Salinicoccus roseus]|uniref:hypothetical protein n=1 Tax=Salinicoccus roseus TaxID=45670 RepID=UPI0023017D03|nr:hypothetical protein [Salinicoccus roseus]
MQWSIAYKLVNNQYELESYGSNMVITDEVDKVLPVDEHVARQANKLEYDGQNLRLKPGETLFSLEELIDLQKQEDIRNGIYPETPKSNIVKVEL